MQRSRYAGKTRPPLGARFARAATLTAFVALGAGLFSGCSDALECKPSVPEGAVYKVTILSETPGSDGCYLVKAQTMSPFSLTVGKTEPTAQRPDCSVTPAAAPPEQLDVVSSQIKILSCSPSQKDMLGQYCEISYEGGCTGHILFYFVPQAGARVDWSAPVVDNLLFHVEDFPASCFPNNSDCLDEYTAKLERMQ